jgi:hypothetical protein
MAQQRGDGTSWMWLWGTEWRGGIYVSSSIYGVAAMMGNSGGGRIEQCFMVCVVQASSNNNRKKSENWRGVFLTVLGHFIFYRSLNLKKNFNLTTF